MRTSKNARLTKAERIERTAAARAAAAAARERRRAAAAGTPAGGPAEPELEPGTPDEPEPELEPEPSAGEPESTSTGELPFSNFLNPESIRPGQQASNGTGGAANAGANSERTERRGGFRPGAGRKPGTPNSGPRRNPADPGEKARLQASLEGIEGILLSLHMMMASFLKIEELNISDTEARKLTKALQRVAELYNIEATEKTIAWVNLITCMGGIYGTRAFAYSMRKKREAADEAKRKQQQQDNVRPFAQAL